MLTCNEFEKHVKFLISKNYNFINFKDNKSFNMGSKMVLITFDDGYLDNYTYVFPIIKKYNIPIII
jgi:peptidoglycan/xylan/chitin deacetylase (PgdA/CDA1 family)